jgi:hypothetical protein
MHELLFSPGDPVTIEGADGDAFFVVGSGTGEVFIVAALIMFVFSASGRELRHFNEIALGLVFLTAALICQSRRSPAATSAGSSQLVGVRSARVGGGRNRLRRRFRCRRSPC